MLPNKKPVSKTGNCDGSHFDGLGVNCNITLMYRDTWLCDDCVEKELAVERSKAAEKVIEDSRKLDSQIELKQDIYNAETVAFIALEASVKQNDEIPVDKKDYALLELVAERLTKLTATIFEDEAKLLALRNERFAMTKNAKEIVARLHATASEIQKKELEKFKNFDINYKPTKASKPAAVPSTKPRSKKLDMDSVREIAKKYDVDASTLLMMMQKKVFKDVETAAKAMQGK